MGTNYSDRHCLHSDEQLVMCYLKYHSQCKAAEELGVSRETVARAVRRSGIELDGRTFNKECAAKITDDQLREACKTMSRMEIAEAFEMHPESVSRRMHKIGRYGQRTRQDGTSVWATEREKRDTNVWRYSKHCDEIVAKLHPDFEFVAYWKPQVKIKCKKCGTEVVKYVSTLRKYKATCKNCKNLQAERQRLHDALAVLAESKTPKKCAECGAIFYSPTANKKYCSDKCKRRRRDKSIRKRCEKYGVEYSAGISLWSVCKRDKGICQLCGKPTDFKGKSWNGYFGAMYPTIDHRLALANGGSHTWGNVQLAHAICNSYKRDIMAQTEKGE